MIGQWTWQLTVKIMLLTSRIPMRCCL